MDNTESTLCKSVKEVIDRHTVYVGTQEIKWLQSKLVTDICNLITQCELLAIKKFIMTLPIDIRRAIMAHQSKNLIKSEENNDKTYR